MEKSTEDLLKILQNKKDYGDFLQQEVDELYFDSISKYLELLLNQKKLTKSEVIEKSNIDKNYAYQIFNGNKTNPSRNKLLMLAFAMGLNLAETKKMLKICGVCDLYVRIPRDSVIIFCLDNKKSLIETNIQLDSLSLDILE